MTTDNTRSDAPTPQSIKDDQPSAHKTKSTDVATDNLKTATDGNKEQSGFVTPNEDVRIANGSKVLLHFEVSLENGTIIDSTFTRNEPVSLVFGDGSLLEGFEKVLTNLRAGDMRTAHLEPDQAFGEWNSDNVQTFSKAQFVTTDSEPEVGMMMEFEDKGKNTLPGVISKVDDDEIEVDFNHPLAGQPILFKVQIFRVTPSGETGIQIM